MSLWQVIGCCISASQLQLSHRVPVDSSEFLLVCDDAKVSHMMHWLANSLQQYGSEMRAKADNLG